MTGSCRGSFFPAVFLCSSLFSCVNNANDGLLTKLELITSDCYLSPSITHCRCLVSSCCQTVTKIQPSTRVHTHQHTCERFSAELDSRCNCDLIDWLFLLILNFNEVDKERLRAERWWVLWGGGGGGVRLNDNYLHFSQSELQASAFLTSEDTWSEVSVPWITTENYFQYISNWLADKK